MDEKEFSKALADIVNERVNKAVQEIMNRIDGFDEKIKAAIAEIPAPKEIDMTAIKSIIADEVANLPKPENGKDADPEVIKAMVADAVAAIPKPENGKDADMGAVKAMIADEVAKIPAPQDGKSVTLDDVKPMVFDYIERQIEKLPKAQDGLDALDLDIFPAINDMKSYPRGMYATHNGGLWKSHKQTDGMDGWECIVDGIAEVKEEYDGERTIKRLTIMASGRTVETIIKMPIPIDRGVYRDTEAYEKGDSVSYGGSVWIARKDAPEGKPGGSDDWRLAVKKGRDANPVVKTGGAK